jgi:Spy/CpxP family protein refolding chaperone
MRSLHALALATALALSSAGVAAQTASENADSMAVPVWNSSNGKLEAVLWIDTSTLDDIEEALIASDLGPEASKRIREAIARKPGSHDFPLPIRGALPAVPRPMSMTGG